MISLRWDFCFSTLEEWEERVDEQELLWPTAWFKAQNCHVSLEPIKQAKKEFKMIIPLLFHVGLQVKNHFQ